MVLHIRTSEANKTIISELTRRMFPQGQSENVISRIALAYSISRGTRLHLEDIRDSKGKEYKEETLFGANKPYYVALVCQHYGIHKEDLNLPRYLKMHVDDGLEKLNKLFTESKSYTGLDFLIEHIERGSEALEDVTAGAIINDKNPTPSKGHFAGPLTLQFGHSLDKARTPIRVVLNDTNVRNNAHLAVVGDSDSGKTEFALNLLQQVVEISNGSLNYLFLDFKELKNEDVKALQPFFDRTKTTFIDVPQKPIPLNPLMFIDNVNEKNRLTGISKFVDIITTYTQRTGATQTQQLKDATKEAFARKKGGNYPSLSDISDCLLEITGSKPDTLTEIMRSLSDYKLFASKADSKGSFLNQNYYFSLSGDLDKTIRFTATFLTIYYIYNTFMNMENAPINDGVQAMRYVLLIDEAHVLFKDKKSQDLLERMLREICSKGVAVVLLSQGIEEFNQPAFDFSSMCENAVLLEIKDRLNLKSMSRFLGFSEAETRLLGQSVSKIKKGLAVTNVKEFKRGELFEIE
ncbi:DndE family protein [Hymenobacter sp. BT186]|uniref:DndE family protein n=1 Tax=Hymenobacter telluris TaxID=2816474 RepID=A0A939JBF6_9BACT|nr:DndE family protein [Hymenobacter telluris]MBO0360879.1 DndE family protein [Hymenobacter telluris]MBW3376908.1 DndE family protein [Hymenobacter norwichensis]